MRLKTVAFLAVLSVALIILGQDTTEIFREVKAGKEPASSVLVPSVAPAVTQESVQRQVSEPAPAVVEKPTTPVAPATVAVKEETETVALAPETSKGGTIKGGLISVSLKEVELNSVIRLFTTLSGANIIIPNLEGGAGLVKVDVNMKEVEWKPALQAILETQGLELYEKVPGTSVYSVRKKPLNALEPMNIKIFKLNYATVSNVTDMIKVMMPTNGNVSVYPARNTIVVQSTPANLLEVEQMITSVDLPRQQVFIEAKFLELTDGASEKLGIDWQMLSGYGAGISDIGGAVNRGKTQTDTTKKYYDITGLQYENVTDLKYVSGPGVTNVLDSNLLRTVTPTLQSDSVKTKGSTLGAKLSADDFKLVLAALKELNGVKVVSNPKIIVANEEKAQIYVGQKEPNIKQATTQAQQADAVTTYNLDPERPFFEYGIKLDVTPTVNTSSNITVSITPSLSRWVRDKTVGNGGTVNTFPVTTEKTIKTVFSLSSGQTAAIGGLTEASANDVERKVPILGSIPLIGRFFSYSSKEKNQAETIIFVTVGLANPDNINMETGLPEDSSLAMRYTAKTKADNRIKSEELKVLNQHEAERSQSGVKKLQDAEQKRLLKVGEKSDGTVK